MKALYPIIFVVCLIVGVLAIFAGAYKIHPGLAQMAWGVVLIVFGISWSGPASDS